MVLRYFLKKSNSILDDHFIKLIFLCTLPDNVSSAEKLVEVMFESMIRQSIIVFFSL